ncbi:MAG: hypothetical protein KDA80_13300, partial [Planctomycetaceae bacterium]|nr:hypothetical protein [Planctomycetaceae bacterium]
ESLPDLEVRLSSLERSLYELSRQVASDESSQVAQEKPEVLAQLNDRPRLQRVADYLKQLQSSTLATIGEQADVRWSVFDEKLTRVQDVSEVVAVPTMASAESAVSGTNLAKALEQLQQSLSGQPLAAVFLLSDVAHNERNESTPQEVARRFEETPVYVVPVGNTNFVRDVVLQSVSAPAVAMRNDDIVIEAVLEAHDCAGEVCHVQLLRDGDVIDFREVSFDTGYASRTVRFQQRVSEVGMQSFQLAVSPINDELTEANNYDEVEVNVTRSDIKVLLADELPRWEYRYLTQLFRRDAKVECDELLFRPRMIATGRREESKSLPVTADEWDQYDIVILGDLPSDHFSVASQEGLREYLQKRGGTAILIAGRRSMPQGFVQQPLADLLPVTPISDAEQNGESFAFRVTRAGESHDALMIAETEAATRTSWDFVNRFSPLREVSDWRQPKASAETLIAAIPQNSVDEESQMKTSAFLCWQPIGRGRLMYLAGPETYRLRTLRGDQLHYRFWGQLLRWAIASDLSAGTELVQLRTNQSRYETGEPVQVVVQLSNDAGEPVTADDLEVEIRRGESDEVRSVPLLATPDVPGEYRAEVDSLAPGVYRLEPTGSAISALQQNSIEEAVASITVQAEIPLEMIDTRSDRALAQQIADLTGGQVLPPTAVSEILALTNLEPIITEEITRQPLWLQWKYLWLVFGCLQMEWIIRKWKGLS